MKRFYVTFLSLLLIACLGPRSEQVGAESPEQSTPNCVQSVSDQPRPPQVREVFPLDKSTHTYVPSISAELDFTVAEEVDPGSLKLFIDGVDVTLQAQMGGTRDWPPSSLQISYILKDSQQGTHCAEVRFQTKKGRMNSYKWSFVIKPR